MSETREHTESGDRSETETGRRGPIETSRRATLGAIGAGVVGAAGVGSATAGQRAGDGRQPTTDDVVWSFETDLGVMKSGPTVVDGTAYVGTRDGVVYAVDEATGELEWEFLTGGIINPSPTVVDERVYIASNDNAVYALETDPDWEEGSFENEDHIWRFETDEEEIGFDLHHIWGSPTVVDGTVYVGNNSGFVYAIDAETGEQEWRFDEPEDWITAAPTYAGGTVYVGTGWNGFDTNVYAIDAETGTEEWRFEADGQVGSSATVADGTVYVGSHLTEETEGNVVPTGALVDPETGRRSAVAPRQFEFFGWLHAIDAETGEEEWTVDAGDWVRGSPTYADGTVYIGSYDGTLHALDGVSGEHVWAFESEGGIDEASPTVVGDTVFVADDPFESGGTVYGVDTETGEAVWTHATEGAGFRSSPTVADGVLYIGSDGGHGGDDENLYALDVPGEGSGNGSRANRGTHGHNRGWTERSTLPTLGEGRPRDLNGDGLYRDVTGTGELDIMDVQTLFEHLDSDDLQTSGAAFDFAGTGDRVSAFDVQALFTALQQ